MGDKSDRTVNALRARVDVVTSIRDGILSETTCPTSGPSRSGRVERLQYSERQRGHTSHRIQSVKGWVGADVVKFIIIDHHRQTLTFCHCLGNGHLDMHRMVGNLLCVCKVRATRQGRRQAAAAGHEGGSLRRKWAQRTHGNSGLWANRKGEQL
jgi:hypothetical protein